MKLFDSLTQSKLTLFNDINSNQLIKIYVCGPTVYDYIHIGNARPLILVDLIVRILKFYNKSYFYLQNITDIDDKIVNKAILTKDSEVNVATKFYQAYLEDLEKLNIILPNKLAKISNYINEQITFIDDLKKKAMFTYQTVIYILKLENILTHRLFIMVNYQKRILQI